MADFNIDDELAALEKEVENEKKVESKNQGNNQNNFGNNNMNFGNNGTKNQSKKINYNQYGDNSDGLMDFLSGIDFSGNYNNNNQQNNNFNNNNFNNNNFNDNKSNYNAPQDDKNINTINEKFENINLINSEQEVCNNSLLSENENPGELSFEEDSEINRLSYIVTDEEMPREIHKHPILKSPLNEEMCIICLKVRTCIKGRKCKNCPLKICEKCVKLVISQYYLNDNHKHNLLLSEVNNWKCDMCKKENNAFKSNFCFYCDSCKFAICLQCYFPHINDDEEYHEHPLVKGSYENFVCKYCKQEAKEGNKCNECGLEICDTCYNKITSYRKKSKLHNHKMFLNERKNWTCKLCKNTFDGIISFYCKECDLDYCLDCFLDNY